MPVSTTYVAVIILLLILVGFVLVAIRTLTRTAAATIRHDMNRMLSSYDFLIINKLDEIKKLDEKIKKKQLNILENKNVVKKEIVKVDPKENHISASVFVKNEANYRNSSFVDSYDSIKDAFGEYKGSMISRSDAIKNDLSSASYSLSLRKILEYLNNNLVFELSLNSNQEQYNILKDSLSKKECGILEEYMKIKDKFSIIEFRDWVRIQLLDNKDQIVIRSGKRDEKNTEYEPSIFEGYQILVGSKLYDYSISKRDIQ